MARNFGLPSATSRGTENQSVFGSDSGQGGKLLSAALPPCGCLTHAVRRTFLLEHRTVVFLMPNVRAKRATTAGRQRPGGENVQGTTGRALVACRCRSA